jgi:hypothetical protein
MPRPQLEAQLTALTQEFVAKLVEAIRNASFLEVAALPGPTGTTGQQRPGKRPEPRAAGASRPVRPEKKAPGSGPSSTPRLRQTAQHRAELGERVVNALEQAHAPLGVRALSSELGVAPDLLAAPLRELRTAGRITKHGDKRATTYSLG